MSVPNQVVLMGRSYYTPAPSPALTYSCRLLCSCNVKFQSLFLRLHLPALPLSLPIPAPWILQFKPAHTVNCFCTTTTPVQEVKRATSFGPSLNDKDAVNK